MKYSDLAPKRRSLPQHPDYFTVMGISAMTALPCAFVDPRILTPELPVSKDAPSVACARPATYVARKDAAHYSPSF